MVEVTDILNTSIQIKIPKWTMIYPIFRKWKSIITVPKWKGIYVDKDLEGSYNDIQTIVLNIVIEALLENQITRQIIILSFLWEKLTEEKLRKCLDVEYEFDIIN